MSPSQEKSIEENLAKTIKLLGTNNLLPINIFIVADDGSILWANDRLLQEIKVKTLHSILHKNVNIFGEIFANGIERVIAKKREEIVEERYKENYYITCRYPVIARDNVVQYIIGISLNITKIKQAELAKQEFLQNMAHDIRTPLAGIIGLAQLQQMGLKSLAESKEYGEMIYGTGNQLLELLNAIIEVIDTEQMMDSLKKEPVDLSGLARELHALMEPAIYTKGLYFNLALDEDLPVILSDKTKLKRVLINILSNAVKFTKEGKINFSIKLLNIENSLAEIEIKIVDTGIGIAKENLDKIFDRFYRAHPTYLAEYSGYGLGLALAKEALDLLGGKIKVASEEGKGSCFTLQFTFPLANKNYDKIENISVVSQKVRVKADPVLIAEDNVIVLRIIKQFLEQAGYAVLPTIDGKAALEALKINSVSWALLDIGLPELNGVEVCKQYRKWEKENSRPYLPIFALTGHSIKEVERKCHEAGIDKVFVKPLNNKMIQAMESFVHFIQQKIS